MFTIPDKAAIRRQTIDLIRRLSPEERQGQETAILSQADRFPGLQQAQTVLLYVSTLPEEINTRPLIELCFQRGQCRVDGGVLVQGLILQDKSFDTLADRRVRSAAGGCRLYRE